MLLPERMPNRQVRFVKVIQLQALTNTVAGREMPAFLLLRSIEAIMTAGFQCAGCGEWNETNVDSSAGMRQQYVEDCQICCKPNVLQVSWDMSAGEYTIRAELE